MKILGCKECLIISTRSKLITLSVTRTVRPDDPESYRKLIYHSPQVKDILFVCNYKLQVITYTTFTISPKPAHKHKVTNRTIQKTKPSKPKNRSVAHDGKVIAVYLSMHSSSHNDAARIHLPPVVTTLGSISKLTFLHAQKLQQVMLMIVWPIQFGHLLQQFHCVPQSSYFELQVKESDIVKLQISSDYLIA